MSRTPTARKIAADEFVMPFGKYRGITLGDIADRDVLYLDWLNGIDIDNRLLMLAVAELCTRYKQQIADAIDAREAVEDDDL